MAAAMLTVVMLAMLMQPWHPRDDIVVWHGGYCSTVGWSRSRCSVKEVVLSPYFNLTIIALIIINSVLLGVEIDIAFQVGEARSRWLTQVSSSGRATELLMLEGDDGQVGEKDIPSWYATVNKIIVCVFVAEIMLKTVVLG